MTQAFAGQWKQDNATIQGAKEYMKALGAPESGVEDLHNVEDVNFIVEGNKITCESKIKGRPLQTDVVAVGETVEKEGPGGMKVVSTGKLENGTLIQNVSIGDKIKLQITRRVEGDRMFNELKAGDATLSMQFYRV